MEKRQGSTKFCASLLTFPEKRPIKRVDIKPDVYENIGGREEYM